jgi:ion channel-forming bestrophin family protein
MHGLLGFVISLLLVFRTNTAYDRGGKGANSGALTNNSRNLTIKLAAMIPETDKEHRFFKKNYSSLCYYIKKSFKP